MAALPHLWLLARKASNSAAILQERAGWLCSAEQLVKTTWSPAGRERRLWLGADLLQVVMGRTSGQEGRGLFTASLLMAPQTGIRAHSDMGSILPPTRR